MSPAPASSRRSGPRIASVPAGHPYVTHLELGAAGLIILPDPPPPGTDDGRWWPPVMLRDGWVEAHADAFELMHLHFGAESLSADALTEVLHALRRAERPLVCTIHDLSHPQLVDQRPHEAQLALLAEHAAELITLTPGAADEIRGRWGRRAEVIEHPYMYELDLPFPKPAPHAEPIVGLQLRDLRPNIDAIDVTRTVMAALARLRADGAAIGLRVEVRDRVRDAETRARLRTLCVGPRWVELIERPRPTDDQLAHSLCELDATVLPYRHGTHSGWLELCWDLGVPIVAPAIGYLAEQHVDPDRFRTYPRGDAVALAEAIAAVLDSAAGAPAGSGQRLAVQRARRERRIAGQPGIRAAHLRVYRRALSSSR